MFSGGGELIAFSAGDALTGGDGADTFIFDGDDGDHDRITDFAPASDRLVISDATTVQQVVIMDGPFGPGLLIIPDPGVNQDDGVFLEGVDAPLLLGVNLFFV